MNQRNNHETLDHFKGSIWVTKHSKDDALPKGLNICHQFKYDNEEDFRVLYYIILTEKGYTTSYNTFYETLEEIVKVCLKANGTLSMLEN
ncbi:hypothetical protein HUN92_13710 [Bacillus firmus]|uniref:hypothetical protein n=1 Tax=Cytobacillus firmus TaxID=1399 RepID=UPI00158020D5|nr:hypothetical protein [Cytobacillus firmus]NUH84776.1 hypothetical protein [Cytobacillus firmus]